MWCIDQIPLIRFRVHGFVVAQASVGPHRRACCVDHKSDAVDSTPSDLCEQHKCYFVCCTSTTNRQLKRPLSAFGLLQWPVIIIRRLYYTGFITYRGLWTKTLTLTLHLSVGLLWYPLQLCWICMMNYPNAVQNENSECEWTRYMFKRTRSLSNASLRSRPITIKFM